jgi:metal-responsive CopG/Arc/MetJ family transcriptional regulator
MHTLSIELPDTLGVRLVEIARQRGTDEDQVVREALQEYLLRQEQNTESDSFEALAREILDAPGDANGPTDLSTNPQRLAGYGR